MLNLWAGVSILWAGASILWAGSSTSSSATGPTHLENVKEQGIVNSMSLRK